MLQAKAIDKWKAVCVAGAFLVSAAVTATTTDNYLLSFVKIAKCSPQTPHPGDVLGECWELQGFYASGSILLNVDKDLVEGLRAADVVVIGNSRTVRSFRADAIDQYFRRKQLRYFVLATEGSGFRVAQMMLENTHARPKILLVNNESFFVDVLEDTYRDFVLSPDRFYPSFLAFYYSRKLQQWICASALEPLKALYCQGKPGAQWRSAVNGKLASDMPDPRGHIPVHVPPEARMYAKPWFMANARAFLASPAVRSSCLIDYIIPSNDSSVDLARSMAADMNAPFVFPNVDDLYSFDGSHLIPESSERWATEFVKDLDPSIDNCLRTTDPAPKLEAVETH